MKKFIILLIPFLILSGCATKPSVLLVTKQRNTYLAFPPETPREWQKWNEYYGKTVTKITVKTKQKGLSREV